MQQITIDTLQLPALSPYARLTEAQLRNRLNPQNGLFICESLKVIRVALAAGCVPLSFLTEEKFIATQVQPLFHQFQLDVPVYTGPRQLLADLTGYQLSRGILCCMHRPPLPSTDQLLSSLLSSRPTSRLAVIDSVVNSENTGAIFRAAAALGIDALLLTPTSCDPLNRRACRVSMGTVFQLPWTYLDNYQQLRSAGFTTVALALSDRYLPINHPALQRIAHLAIILGNEGDGLSDSVLRQCDHLARIPMHRGVDSLNVAAAAAVAFYQFCR